MLSGSSVRTCLPTSTWSGTVAVCQPRLCEDLEAPDNGAILPPCNNEFSSVCTLLCNFGYKLSGPERQNCTVTSNGALEWTEAPSCEGREGGGGGGGGGGGREGGREGGRLAGWLAG